jgi:hypothetical protein
MNRQQLAAYNGSKGGRPQKLTKALAGEICAILAKSNRSLYALAQDHPHWPNYDDITRATSEKPWFAQMYGRARELQADFIMQNNMDLQQELLKSPKDMANVQAHKVVMDDRRWYASRMFRKQYGDNPAVQLNQIMPVQVTPEQLADIRARLEQVREQRSRELEPRSPQTLPVPEGS